MKKSIAILLALAMLLAFAACGSKPDEPTVTETKPNVTVEDTTGENTTVPEATVPEESTSEGEETTAEETTLAEPIAAPTNTAEIIALYNKAVNNAYDKKAGFEKTRYTDNENIQMSLALKAFKGLIEKFVGIGEANKYVLEVKKGNWETEPMKHYLRSSTLTEADIKSAQFKQDGDDYVITLYIKDGNSKGGPDEKFTNAPLDKCGICVGNVDKSYFDHKTGEVIYDALAGTYAGAKITENYTDAKVVAEIDPATGELEELTVTYTENVAIDINIGSGTASGLTHIEYDDFVY